ncbi:MAG: hypothetical protein LBH07_01175 [Treponema sp.]|jgi:NAD(P)-dependent dehydrogenase (short-subunit alcohol dehydrogenase family)|nr:hypothetical protein [Treponema sp.]
MTRGILIAGNESSLLTALCAEAAKRVEKYAVTFIPREHKPELPRKTLSDRQIVLDWNPSSPVSAKTLILSCINQMEHLDDAVLVCSPPAYRKKSEDFSIEEIDYFIDRNIKGWFFLVRELTTTFTARKQGTLSLVLSAEPGFGPKDDEPDFTGPVAASAFRSFARGVLLSSLNYPFNVLGFSTPRPGEENAYAAYIFKTMEENKRNSGKWHKFSKLLGFFGR